MDQEKNKYASKDYDAELQISNTRTKVSPQTRALTTSDKPRPSGVTIKESLLKEIRSSLTFTDSGFTAETTDLLNEHFLKYLKARKEEVLAYLRRNVGDTGSLDESLKFKKLMSKTDISGLSFLDLARDGFWNQFIQAALEKKSTPEPDLLPASVKNQALFELDKQADGESLSADSERDKDLLEGRPPKSTKDYKLPDQKGEEIVAECSDKEHDAELYDPSQEGEEIEPSEPPEHPNGPGLDLGEVLYNAEGDPRMIELDEQMFKLEPFGGDSSELHEASANLPFCSYCGREMPASHAGDPVPVYECPSCADPSESTITDPRLLSSSSDLTSAGLNVRQASGKERLKYDPEGTPETVLRSTQDRLEQGEELENLSSEGEAELSVIELEEDRRGNVDEEMYDLPDQQGEEIKSEASFELEANLFDDEVFTQAERTLGALSVENLSEGRPRLMVNSSELIRKASRVMQKSLRQIKGPFTMQELSMGGIRQDKVGQNGQILLGSIVWNARVASHRHRRVHAMEFIMPVVNGEPQPLAHVSSGTGDHLPYNLASVESLMHLPDKTTSGRRNPKIDISFREES